MEVPRGERAYDTGSEIFLGRWSGLPALEDSTFESPWKSKKLPPLTTFEPQVIQPDQLHHSQCSPSRLSSDTPSASSAITSRTSTSSCNSLNDGAGPTASEYRPRGSTGKRKGSARRITPRSKKHAHELSRNRTAATKYRNRQKNYVDGLQQKCKDAEMQREVNMSTVQALRDELFELRRELLRHANCGHSKVREYNWNIGSPQMRKCSNDLDALANF